MRYRDLRERAPSYDLKGRYDTFNQKYFGGELPDIPLEFADLKSMGGQVKYRFMRSTKTLVPGSMKLQLSTRWERTEEALDAILLHEMIHVYFAIKGMVKENHGPRFMAMLYKLKRASGIDIPVKDNVSDLELSDTTKLKAIGVLLIIPKTGAPSVMLMSAPNAHARKDELQTLWMKRDIAHAALFTVATPTWTKMASRFPMSRKVDGSRYFMRDKDALDDLAQNGHVLFNFAKK